MCRVHMFLLLRTTKDMHHGRHYDPRCTLLGHSPKPGVKLNKKGFGHKFNSRAPPPTATPVAHVAVDHTILGSMVVGRSRLESRLIPHCFHGHFCLGAGVFDPQHGDSQQASGTSVYCELA